MNKAFTSKSSTTSRGRGFRGRGTNTSTGGSNIKRAEVNNNLDNRTNRVGPVPPTNSIRTPGKIVNNRGRGTTSRFQTGYSSARNMSQTPGDPTDIPENSSNDNSLDSRISHASGYTVISPNEKKRREITQQAKHNLQAYEQHKEETRLHHVSYVGTTGGGMISEQEARQKAAIQHSKTAFNSRIKRESVRKDEKEREEAFYKDKNMAARKQTELNQEREKKEEQRRNGAYRDEMRRKNAQFLDGLEAAKPSSTSSERYTGRTQDNLQIRNEHSKQSTDVSQLSPETSDDHRTDDLHRLQVMFPNYTRNALSEILNQMGSIQSAVDILSD